MPMQIAGSLATAFLAASSLWTASDPFVGKWRLDVSKTLMVDGMIIEAAGPNKYTFRFEGGPPETVVADGTDQPGVQGTTLAVKSADSRTLQVVRKQGGRVIISAAWKVAGDDKTLQDSFSQLQDDGTFPTDVYHYKRTAGASGFVGAWERTTSPTGLKYEMEIKPYGDHGLSFVRQGSPKNVPFDGKDHAFPGATPDLTASGRRQGERALELTDKAAGKVTDVQAYVLSADGKTLTANIRRTGQTTPDKLVFVRE